MLYLPTPQSCIFGYSISPAFLSTSIPCLLLQKQFWRSTHAFCPIAKVTLKSFSPWPNLQCLVWILRCVPLQPQTLLTLRLHPLWVVKVALSLLSYQAVLLRGCLSYNPVLISYLPNAVSACSIKHPSSAHDSTTFHLVSYDWKSLCKLRYPVTLSPPLKLCYYSFSISLPQLSILFSPLP